MNSQTLGEISLSPLQGGAFVAHVSAEAREQLAARFAVYTSTGHQAQILECRGSQRTQLSHLVALILAAAPHLIGHLLLMWRPVTSRQPMICQASSRRLGVDLRCDSVPLYGRQRTGFPLCDVHQRGVVFVGSGLAESQGAIRRTRLVAPRTLPATGDLAPAQPLRLNRPC